MKNSLLFSLIVLSLTLTYQLLQNKEPSREYIMNDLRHSGYCRTDTRALNGQNHEISLPYDVMSKCEIELFKLRLMREIEYNKSISRAILMRTHNSYRLIILNFFALIITLIAYGFTLRKDFLLKDAEIQALKAQINQQKEIMDLKDDAILIMYERKS